MNMKTATRMRIPGMVLLILIAAVFAVGMAVASPAYATTESGTDAGTGSNSITGTYAPWANMEDVSGLGSTTLHLYRVGSFVDKDGEATIELEDNLKPYTLPATKKGEDTDETAWTTEWLNFAGTIAMKIDSDEDLAKQLKVKDATTGATDGAYTFSGLKSGVYLITGESQTVTLNGKETKWWPQAMVVQVLQGESKANLKPQSGDFRNFRVYKTWSGGENARPKSITVHVQYDGQEIDGSPFTLDESNNWSATWKSKMNQTDASKWSVTEDMGTAAIDFTAVITTNDSGDTRTYNITNTYNPPPSESELELVKSLPVILKHGDGSKVSTTFTFEIKGYLGDQVVYHRYAGMAFNDAGEQTLKITGMPVGMTKVEVTEMTSANYKVAGSATKEADFDEEASKYSVSFENTFDDTHRYSGGVVNRYDKSDSGYKFDFSEGIVHK